MRILRRYFLKEFLRYFVILLVTFTAIAVVAEFFDKAPEFYEKKPSVWLIAQYLLLQAPGITLYALPFASLFSILVTIGLSSKWNETMVIKASGSSTKTIFSSFLLLGLVISIIALILGETLVPAATRTATLIRKERILNESMKIVQSENALWLKGLDGSLVRIDGFVENQNRVLKTSIFSFNPSFGLEKRTEAEEAEWENGVWELQRVKVFDFMNGTLSEHESLPSNSFEEPKIFREEMKKPKEMNFMELFAYYSRLQKAGFRNLKYLVRLYEKLAYPTINFVMMLFGIALALNSRLGGSLMAVGLGVLVSVSYWLVYSVSISFGNTGLLPPWIAPWIGPVTFCIAGSVMYMKIEE